MLHICSLSHCECNYMCNQLWSNHISLIYYFSLYSIIFHYYHYFSHYHYYSHFCCKEWYTFSCDTALMQQDVFPFVSFNIFILCCFIPLGFIDHLVCDTAFGMQHTKFWGVCVTRQHLGDIWVIFRSPRVTYYTGYTFGFNVNYSYLIFSTFNL